MTIELVKIEKEPDGFSLWIDGEQDFQACDLMELMAPLGILSIEDDYLSMVPAEVYETVKTDEGVFHIHHAFDEFPGTTISSEDEEIIDRIQRLLLKTGKFHLR